MFGHSHTEKKVIVMYRPAFVTFKVNCLKKKF